MRYLCLTQIDGSDEAFELKLINNSECSLGAVVDLNVFFTSYITETFQFIWRPRYASKQKQEVIEQNDRIIQHSLDVDVYTWVHTLVLLTYYLSLSLCLIFVWSHTRQAAEECIM